MFFKLLVQLSSCSSESLIMEVSAFRPPESHEQTEISLFLNILGSLRHFSVDTVVAFSCFGDASEVQIVFCFLAVP